MTSLLWACEECGCTDIQQAAWIYVNTGDNTGEDGPNDTIWCPQCDCETGISHTATEPKPYE